MSSSTQRTETRECWVYHIEGIEFLSYVNSKYIAVRAMEYFDSGGAQQYFPARMSVTANYDRIGTDFFGKRADLRCRCAE